jgi:hypothetical protein
MKNIKPRRPSDSRARGGKSDFAFEMTRLVSSDLTTLGIFLYGPRWQTRLARAIQRSDRSVRYWAAGDRPLSITASACLEARSRPPIGSPSTARQ